MINLLLQHSFLIFWSKNFEKCSPQRHKTTIPAVDYFNFRAKTWKMLSVCTFPYTPQWRKLPSGQYIGSFRKREGKNAPRTNAYSWNRSFVETEKPKTINKTLKRNKKSKSWAHCLPFPIEGSIITPKCLESHVNGPVYSVRPETRFWAIQPHFQIGFRSRPLSDRI